MNKKQIEFTDDQYKTLVKLLFYGEWILNANKVGVEEKNEEYVVLKNYIFSLKEDFNLKHWFSDLKFDEEELKESITMSLLEEVFAYNEDTFWFYLKEKLAYRDAKNEHLKKGGRVTNLEKIEDLKYDYEDKYEKAFEKRDIENLVLKED